MRIIIACAGRVNDPKWHNYMNIPKHLAPIGKEPLLDRTVRQILEYDRTSDIYITTSNNDRRYRHRNVTTVRSPGGSSNEYIGSRYWWSNDNRTVLMLGDVYWTDAAINTVLSTDNDDITWFGRVEKTNLRKSKGEIFAVSWLPKHHKLLDEHLLLVLKDNTKYRPGWKLYRSIHGIPMNEHRITDDWVEINDHTDDFDKPASYINHPAVKGRR